MNQFSLQLHQLARGLDERFRPYVHTKGVDGKNAERDLDLLRSRALAAMAASITADISDQDAAARVTDYFFDDGIDGFAVAKAASEPPEIHLIQVKWSSRVIGVRRAGDATADSWCRPVPGRPQTIKAR